MICPLPSIEVLFPSRIMISLSVKILVTCSVCFAACCRAAEEAPRTLPRSTPEEQGVSSPAILKFVNDVEQQVDAVHSFMVIRHGHVVAEGWWAPANPGSLHQLYSMSKGFLSTAAGLAIAEGKMSLDDLVLPYFPAASPANPSENLKAMRVRDLLIMSAGYEEGDLQKLPDYSVKAFLALPVAHKPGTHFLYSGPPPYLLAAIIQKVTGMTVLDYLRPRLFVPLGIENPTWETSKEGIELGGSGLSVRTEDIARFGQLYLQQGRWNGQQLLPASWVEVATTRQTSTGSNPASDWEQGYGYYFWRDRPHGVYRTSGAYGQICAVMPDQDTVVALTSGVKSAAPELQHLMNLIWDDLIPAMQTTPLPADEANRVKLVHKLASLTLPTQSGASSSPQVAQINGRQYAFPVNDQQLATIVFERAEGSGAVTLVAKFNGHEQRLTCGYGSWHNERFSYGTLPEQPVAVSGAWITEDTYAAKVCFYETPFIVTFRLRFSDNQLFFDTAYNFPLEPPQKTQLVGLAK